MTRIIIMLWLVATAASAEYVATFDRVNVKNALAVTNGITAGGDIAAGGSISAGEDLAASNNLTVGGTAYINDLQVTNDISAGGDITAGGNIDADQNISADWDITARGNIYGRDFTATNNLYVLKNAFVYGLLDVTGYSQFNGPMYGSSLWLTNWIRVDGNALHYGPTFLYGSTEVSGDFLVNTAITLRPSAFLNVDDWASISNYTDNTTLPEYVSDQISQSESNLTAELVADMARAYYIGGTNYLVEKNTYSGSTNRVVGFRRGYTGAPLPPPDPPPQVWEDVGTLYMDRETVYDWYYYSYGNQAAHNNTDTYHWTGEALFCDFPYVIITNRLSALTLDVGTAYANEFVGGGSGLTNVTAAQVGAVSTNDPRYLTAVTNSAWLWSGAQIVTASTSAYSIGYGGPAVWNAGSNRFDVLPYSITNYGAITGTVTITMASNAYLSSIGGTWYLKTVSGTTPQIPVYSSLIYDTTTSAVLSAWCSTNPADATSDYYAYFSDLVVYTYDRTGMTPYQYTNDAAGIVARVDPLPTGNTDARRVVNSESLSAAIAAAKPDIAKEAWAYMPSGARQPTYNAITLDKPLIQQSAGVTFMQSGDYFAQSYVGTWDATVTGSVWRVGPSGLTALEIASTNINLAITAFTVRTNVATFVIATNGVVGTPYIEQCADLTAPQWLYVAGQTITNNTTNWTATCSTVATMRFFRAVSPGGANKITASYQLDATEGITSRKSIIQTTGGWTDLSFPVQSIYVFGLSDIDYFPQSNSVLFKTTCNTNFSSDNVWLVGQLPHDAATNSAYSAPHIHFLQTSATQTNMFLIRYKTYQTGAQVPEVWIDLPLTNSSFAYTTGTLHQIAYGAGIPGPFGISQNFDIKIWSRGGEAVHMKYFDIHYRRDSLGSDLELSKSF
jgi:hypothetical protein